MLTCSGRILGIILPVFLIILVGYFYARRVKPDMAMVNRISMTILAPALIFSALASKDFSIAENAPLMLGSIGIVLGSGLLAWPFVRLLHVDYRTFVPPMMFNNCGNIGLPLAALAYGSPGFSAMVALFTISNLLHFTLGAWMIDHHARFGNLLRNPMVWSTFLGFALRGRAPADAGMGLGRDQDGRRRADPDDAAVAGRAALRSALGRLASGRGRRPRVPADGHRHRRAAGAAAGARLRCSRAC